MDDSALLPVYGPRDLVIDHGEGCYLFDDQGRRYLDCVGGVAVNALGHCHPAVVAAIEKQARKFVHASNLYLLPSQVELAGKLRQATGYAKVFFCNSGTEANEGAIKFARRHSLVKNETGPLKVITFSSSFHGRTYASMTATGQDRIRQGFGPLLEGFLTLPFGDAVALRRAVDEGAAAILFEPILAEGGIWTHPPEVVEVMLSAQRRGVLLIADEVQTGLCRTGTFLACEWMGVKPDLVTMAKPLGGGLPLGAILVSSEVASSLKQGDHGSTFGDNPVACAAGCAVMDVLQTPGFSRQAGEIARRLAEELARVLRAGRSRGIPVGEVRGRGFLLGFPYGGDIPTLISRMRARGVLIYRAGTDVVRLLPPLILGETEIEILVKALEESLLEK